MQSVQNNSSSSEALKKQDLGLSSDVVGRFGRQWYICVAVELRSANEVLCVGGGWESQSRHWEEGPSKSTSIASHWFRFPQFSLSLAFPPRAIFSWDLYNQNNNTNNNKISRQSCYIVILLGVFTSKLQMQFGKFTRKFQVPIWVGHHKKRNELWKNKKERKKMKGRKRNQKIKRKTGICSST